MQGFYHWGLVNAWNMLINLLKWPPPQQLNVRHAVVLKCSESSYKVAIFPLHPWNVLRAGTPELREFLLDIFDTEAIWGEAHTCMTFKEAIDWLINKNKLLKENSNADEQLVAPTYLIDVTHGQWKIEEV